MKKYRIEHRYPCYGGGCIPYDGYFVQVRKKGVLSDEWIDITGFTNREKAEKLKKMLEDKNPEE